MFPIHIEGSLSCLNLTIILKIFPTYYTFTMWYSGFNLAGRGQARPGTCLYRIFTAALKSAAQSDCSIFTIHIDIHNRICIV